MAEQSTFDQEAVRKVVCRIVCNRSPTDRFIDRSAIRRAFLDDDTGKRIVARSIELGNSQKDPTGNMVDWYSAYISDNHPDRATAEWVRCPECGTGLRRRPGETRGWWSYRVARPGEVDRCR